MFATEEEAKEMWCPLARRADLWVLDRGQTVVAVNRDHDGTAFDGCRCLASGCMAWRWTDKRDDVDNQMLGVCGLAKEEWVDG